MKQDQERELMGKSIVLATRNKHKIEEIAALLEGSGLTVKTFQDFPDFPEVTENGRTFRENALKKARAICQHTGLAALADDSGLEVDVLQGMPGVRSARFAGEKATDAENSTKLLNLLRNVAPAKRWAQFRCVMAVAFPDGKTITADETCRGKIVDQPKGAGGFGYDPIFWFPYANKTFAELDPETKNKLSHRGKALARIKDELMKLLTPRDAAQPQPAGQ
jgi:XTP/dITP diphosphohydrolase